MRKAIITLLLAMPIVGFGQSITKTVQLKSTDLGNQKLEAITGKDTTYVMLIATGNRFQKYLTVDLGRKEDAIRILNFLLDAEIKKGDIIRLENPTDNLVTKNALGGFLVHSEGRQLHGQLRKPSIKGFIEAIKEFSE